MSTEKIIESLLNFAERLDRLENAVKESNNSKIHFDIHINDLHLNELNLEELAFHLERLDIQELSGMLNMGNTFSPKVHGKEKVNELVPERNSALFLEKENVEDTSTETKKGKETFLETERSGRDIQILINGDPVSYSLTN
ncbi:hypothetical protein V1499_03070 [Neobacillus sp. SCS-31]|uniref:hypothetical protein n=1 Tax=Neobacillus oceani TaxID=3115292 RepID=UPI003905B988